LRGSLYDLLLEGLLDARWRNSGGRSVAVVVTSFPVVVTTLSVKTSAVSAGVADGQEQDADNSVAQELQE
jgi:hypothetical protein